MCIFFSDDATGIYRRMNKQTNKTGNKKKEKKMKRKLIPTKRGALDSGISVNDGRNLIKFLYNLWSS